MLCFCPIVALADDFPRLPESFADATSGPQGWTLGGVFPFQDRGANSYFVDIVGDKNEVYGPDDVLLFKGGNRTLTEAVYCEGGKAARLENQQQLDQHAAEKKGALVLFQNNSIVFCNFATGYSAHYIRRTGHEPKSLDMPAHSPQPTTFDKRWLIGIGIAGLLTVIFLLIRLVK